jgi:hypothetical protein
VLNLQNHGIGRSRLWGCPASGGIPPQSERISASKLTNWLRIARGSPQPAGCRLEYHQFAQSQTKNWTASRHPKPFFIEKFLPGFACDLLEPKRLRVQISWHLFNKAKTYIYPSPLHRSCLFKIERADHPGSFRRDGTGIKGGGETLQCDDNLR